MAVTEFAEALKENITKEKIRNVYRAIGSFIMFTLTNLAYPLFLEWQGADASAVKAAWYLYYIALYGAAVGVAGVIVSTFLGDNKGNEPMTEIKSSTQKLACPLYLGDRLDVSLEAAKSIRDMLTGLIKNGEITKKNITEDKDGTDNATNVHVDVNTNATRLQ